MEIWQVLSPIFVQLHYASAVCSSYSGTVVHLWSGITSRQVLALMQWWLYFECEHTIQMGSTMKKSIFDEHTSKALRQWHRKATQKRRELESGRFSFRTLGVSLSQSFSRVNSIRDVRMSSVGSQRIASQSRKISTGTGTGTTNNNDKQPQPDLLSWLVK